MVDQGHTIGGNLTISRVAADWLGAQFNTIGKNAVLTNITALDPGDPGRTVAVVETRCSGISSAWDWPRACPQASFPGETNHFRHEALGQCAATSTPL